MSQFNHLIKITARTNDISPPHLTISKALRQVHRFGVFNKIPFAIALPGWVAGQERSIGSALHVFLQSENHANSFLSNLKDSPIALFTSLSDPQAIEGVQQHEAFVMRRMPNRKNGNQRQYKMPKELLDKFNRSQKNIYTRKKDEYKELPFIVMQSSKGHQFSLHIDRMALKQPQNGGQPNGYGLSRPTQIVALPMVSS